MEIEGIITSVSFTDNPPDPVGGTVNVVIWTPNGHLEYKRPAANPPRVGKAVTFTVVIAP